MKTPLSLITRFGGWKDRHLIDAFVHYSDIVMNHYKGKVRYWLTFNEINAMDMAPYMGGGLIEVRPKSETLLGLLLCLNLIKNKR
ncbi:hypothetical protein GCM10008918_15750 [Lactobacillus kefiranofaciens subsp. kefiranofaciens]